MSEPQTVFGVGERDRGKRLDQFMQERIPGLSRARIQRAIEERVTLSWGVRARAATPVRPGGEVRIGHTPIVEDVVDVPLPILSRGAGWLAVDKPSGIVVHPVNAVRENSLIRTLRRQEALETLAAVPLADAENRLRLAHPSRHRSARRMARLASGIGRSPRDEASTHAHGRPLSVATSPDGSRTRNAWKRSRRSG